MILDTELDQGIRMSSEWVTMADIGARYPRSAWQEARCHRRIAVDEVAQAIVFMVRNDFVTGTTIDVDGGWLLSQSRSPAAPTTRAPLQALARGSLPIDADIPLG